MAGLLLFPSPQGGSETVGDGGLCPTRTIVSIPSRRVGDEPQNLDQILNRLFPSPQGGSETGRGGRGTSKGGLFPSPQGGSETNASTACFFASSVSIPSRRVGDKAKGGVVGNGFVVSIPSRRVGDNLTTTKSKSTSPSFHPLKAGRRLSANGVRRSFG